MRYPSAPTNVVNRVNSESKKLHINTGLDWCGNHFTNTHLCLSLSLSKYIYLYIRKFLYIYSIWYGFVRLYSMLTFTSTFQAIFYTCLDLFDNAKITKNIRYLEWRYRTLYLIRLFWGSGFPDISRIHTAYVWFPREINWKLCRIFFSLEVSDIGQGGQGEPTYDIVDGSEIRNNHLGCINRRNNRINMDKLPTSTGVPRISEQYICRSWVRTWELEVKETLSKHKPFIIFYIICMYLLLLHF